MDKCRSLCRKSCGACCYKSAIAGETSACDVDIPGALARCAADSLSLCTPTTYGSHGRLDRASGSPYNRNTLKDSSGQLSHLRDAAWRDASTDGSSPGVRLRRADCEVTGRSRKLLRSGALGCRRPLDTGNAGSGFVSAFGRDQPNHKRIGFLSVLEPPGTDSSGTGGFCIHPWRSHPCAFFPRSSGPSP